MPFCRPLFQHLARLCALLGALAVGPAVLAQTSSPKLSADLAQAAVATNLPAATWIKTVNGQRLVRVLITATGADPALLGLRAAMLAQGGSVHYVYLSVRALAGMVPVSALTTLAARSDVLAIVPNRAASRSGSLVQDSTGSPLALRAGTGIALDGAGVGIAVLDSGIDFNHRNFLDANGKSRVATVVDIAGYSKKLESLAWLPGMDFSPEGSKLAKVTGFLTVTAEKALAAPSATVPDPYGHGSHVASIAAGAGAYQQPNSSGVAPAATLYDVRVLNDKGVGNLADVLAGIDWVIQRARLYNIRVMNLSLAASSVDSVLVDPLARAARSAVAEGIVVVAAAGNSGRNAAGAEVYGAIGSPGHEPSVITVGAANPRGTAARSDDSVAGFSARGPGRGSMALRNGTRWFDNTLKPDLVAPGNRLLGAVANEKNKPAPQGNLLATLYPALMADAGAAQLLNQELMVLSGTSVAAPAVAGAAALLLQANPGLTPPLVKAILQYTAQPLPGANLLQQGAGLLNLEGAVRLAQALRTDVGPALAAGTLPAGAPLLAPGKGMPEAVSTVNGESFAWSRLAFAGGTHVLSGAALFTQFQPVYDPRLSWQRQVVLRSTIRYRPAFGTIAANTVPEAIVEANAGPQPLLTPQVLLMDALAGPNSAAKGSGLFRPAASLAYYAATGGGQPLGSGFVLGEGFILAEGLTLAQQRLLSTGLVLGEGFILGEGLVLAEGFVLAEGLMLGSGFVLAEGFILGEGFVLGEGFILAEALGGPARSSSSLLGEP